MSTGEPGSVGKDACTKGLQGTIVHQGPKGETGDPGKDGAQGIPGPQGETCPAGLSG